MAPKYRTKDGYTVEVVHLAGTSGNHDGEWLRIRYQGYHVTDVRSIAELERYIPLRDLEADGLARSRRDAARRPRQVACLVTTPLGPGSPGAVRPVLRPVPDQDELEVAQMLRPASTASRSIVASSASVKLL
jgi:hypothetical protein